MNCQRNFAMKISVLEPGIPNSISITNFAYNSDKPNCRGWTASNCRAINVMNDCPVLCGFAQEGERLCSGDGGGGGIPPTTRRPPMTRRPGASGVPSAAIRPSTASSCPGRDSDTMSLRVNGQVRRTSCQQEIQQGYAK